MPGIDYYQVLGVSADADPEALKRAYRTRVLEWHPDRNPHDQVAAERFKKVQEAYAVLGDPERRHAYDAEFASQLFAPPSVSSTVDVVVEAEHARSDGSGVRADVSISFEQALRGGHTHVANEDGELVRVTIPRGCRNGTTVRVLGRGRQVNGRQSSDLYVCFHVQPHPRFRRDGTHLHVIETISVMEAMLGATRCIENPYGHRIRVTIPPGMQPGERLRLRGLGVETARGAGDLFVEIDVQVPKELSDEQRIQLRQAAKNLGLL